MFKSNIPEGFDPARRHYAVRPDNVARGKENAEKISKAITALHQDPQGPYSEWQIGRPTMNRENITTEHLNQDPAIVKKKIENSKLWNSSAAGRAAYQRGREKLRRPVKDPQGQIWPSAQAAAGVWFPEKSLERAVKTIRYQIKHQLGWHYVD